MGVHLDLVVPEILVLQYEKDPDILAYLLLVFEDSKSSRALLEYVRSILPQRHEVIVQKAAIRIIKKCGNASDLPLLRRLQNQKNPDLKETLEWAIYWLSPINMVPPSGAPAKEKVPLTNGTS